MKPTALIPEERLLLTTVERPVIWIYLPYAKSGLMTFSLELADEETDTLIYAAPITYKLDGSAKLVRLSLPNLPLNHSYKWSFLEVCESKGEIKKSLLFYAHIERISLPGLLPTLPAGIDAYRSQGLWLDAFNGVAELRMNNREQALWTQLLEEINLSEIASVPFAATVDPQ